ncbi:MAG: GHKL domain-containing protein [Lachnospiraceae bacterium]|nr:GHKL domain-containing protein [Lachnospiraceae bacterium]
MGLRFIDAAWILQLLLVTASWFIVGQGKTLKTKRLWLYIRQFLLLFAGLLLASVVMAFMNLGFAFAFTWNLVIGAAGLIFLMFAYPYPNKIRLTIWCCMYACILCLMEIAGCFSILTGMFFRQGAMEGVVRVSCYVLMLPVAIYLHTRRLNRFDNIPFSGVMMIVTGAVCMVAFCVLSVWKADMSNTEMIRWRALTYILIFVLMLLAIHTMYSMCQERERVLELQAERQRLINEKETAALVEKNLSDLRSIRHDIKNKYAYMEILLKEKRYEELETYFEEVSMKLPEGLSYVDCGNQVMNTILNMEISKAQTQGISVERQLMVPPALGFPADDLCSLIANMMDNAIEESVRMKNDGKESDIHIEIYPKESYLFIQCLNHTDLDKLRKAKMGLKTTKKDLIHHGFGTQIITRLAEKYNGCAEFTLEEGKFTAKAILDMMWNQE